MGPEHNDKSKQYFGLCFCMTWPESTWYFWFHRFCVPMYNFCICLLQLPMMDRSLSWSEGQRPQELMCAPTLPLGSQNDCDFCQKSAECNKQGLPEELLFCKDCNAKGIFLFKYFFARLYLIWELFKFWIRNIILPRAS